MLPIARACVVTLTFLIVSTGLEAQELVTTGSGRKSGTYLKAGLAHWQGNIFSGNSLTQWDADVFGADYALTSASLEIESYFSSTKLLLSGFSVGYRKDNLSRGESGHMVSAKIFHEFPLKVFGVKAGGGVEWGMPSFNFDQTEFASGDDGSLRYRHTYIARNADVPRVGTSTDGAVYPFASLSLVQRPWIFLVEAGVRMNFIRFNLDDYLVAPSDEVTTSFNDKRVLAPYLFVDVGLRLF